MQTGKVFAIVQILKNYLKINANKDFYLNVTSNYNNLIISKVKYINNTAAGFMLFDMSKLKERQRFIGMLSAWEFGGNISESKVTEVLELLKQIATIEKM
jgi:hypothetical protein